MTKSKLTRAFLAAAVVVALAACMPGLESPGSTSQIALVSSTTQGGWKYDQYRNSAYPCASTGYQTFTIATNVGSAPTASGPLWVRMHGGGVGYFNAAGQPVPNTKQMDEESAATQRSQFVGPLIDKLKTQVTGLRLLTVSMCSHDIYGGPNIADPNNPNTTPDGKPRTVNGLFATKAAIQFATGTYPTDDFFLHGGSAGSFGSYHVAWSLQQQGVAPAGIVADSGILNPAWQYAHDGNPVCGRTAEAVAEIPKRLHPQIANIDNTPDKLVADGRLTVPVVDVFSTGDPGQCGNDPMPCPMPDGSTTTLGSVTCLHEPMRQAIAAQGAGSRSISMSLCVSPVGGAATCATHTPTSKDDRVNSAAPWPADYTAPIVTWVQQRMADD